MSAAMPRRSKLARIAGWTLLVGWGPLLLYIPFDALRGGGGNPIGLGLLGMLATCVALGLLVAEAIAALRSRRRRGPGGSC